MQIIGDYLAVAIESAEGESDQSIICFIDLNTNREAENLRIIRSGRKAGAIGLTNYNIAGNEIVYIAVHDNGVLDFYTTNSLLNDLSCAFSAFENYTLPHGYDCISLLADQNEKLYMAGFWTEDTLCLPKDDYIDLYQITISPSPKCTILNEKLHFTTHGTPIGPLGPHFRYAGGSDICEPGLMRILASSRGVSDDLNINVFQYGDANFSMTSSCSATSDYGICPGHYVYINGSSDLKNFIRDDNGAEVYSIRLDYDSIALLSYTLTVDAKGPEGIFHSFLIQFTDKTGDTYDLRIYDSDRKEHTVQFNSDIPFITHIAW